jgi:hypothetical protein
VTARRAARLRAGLAAAAAACALLAAATSCILVNGRSGDALKFPLAPHA